MKNSLAARVVLFAAMAAIWIPARADATDVPQSNSMPSHEAAILEEVAVNAAPEIPYKPTRTTLGTKTDTELRDIPQTVNVVDRQLLEDRGIVKINKAIETVPGIQGLTDYGGMANGADFNIRGFRSTTTYRDGYRDFGFVSPRDISVFERIEVLKGPASVLYGTNDPGGMVNYVTKRPKFEEERSLTLTYGSYQAKRGVLDMTGSLNEADTAAYRLIATLDDRESHRDYVNSDTQLLAPSLLFKLGESTELTLMAEFIWQNYLFERGFYPEEEFLGLPRDRFLEDPDLNFAESKSSRFTAELKHAFNDQWSGRAAFSLLRPKYEKLNLYPDGLAADRSTLNQSLDYSNEETRDVAAQLELVGNFEALGVSHQLLTGVEYYESEFRYTFAPFGLATSIDIHDPVYGQLAIPPGFLDQVGFGNHYGADTKAIYVQDQITFSEQWKATVGLRYDSSKLFNDDLVDDTASLSEQTERKVSPRIGFVYQPRYRTSIFAGYSTSFSPQVFIRKQNGGLVKPEVGKQVEIGWREEWLNSRLASTVSVYEIHKENVSTTDPANPLFQIQVGEQRSRGIEFELQGEVAPGLTGTWGASVIDAEVTKDNVIPEGSRLENYAKFSSSLWLKYQPTPLGWFVGGGVFYTGRRDMPINDLEFPPQTVVDALVGYNASKWEAQLNLNNLTDEETYVASYLFIPGAGRNADLTVRFYF